MKYWLYTLGIVICVGFGWALNTWLTEKQLTIEYGDIHVEKIKTTYKAVQPIITLDVNTLLVEHIVIDTLDYQIIHDSTSYKSDTLDYKINHTTLIDPNKIDAKGIFDVFIQMKARQDSIFIDRQVLKEVPMPFWGDGWFYTSIGALIMLILCLFK